MRAHTPTSVEYGCKHILNNILVMSTVATLIDTIYYFTHIVAHAPCMPTVLERRHLSALCWLPRHQGAMQGYDFVSATFRLSLNRSKRQAIFIKNDNLGSPAAWPVLDFIYFLSKITIPSHQFAWSRFHWFSITFLLKKDMITSGLQLSRPMHPTQSFVGIWSTNIAVYQASLWSLVAPRKPLRT